MPIYTVTQRQYTGEGGKSDSETQHLRFPVFILAASFKLEMISDRRQLSTHWKQGTKAATVCFQEKSWINSDYMYFFHIKYMFDKCFFLFILTGAVQMLSQDGQRKKDRQTDSEGET